MVAFGELTLSEGRNRMPVSELVTPFFLNEARSALGDDLSPGARLSTIKPVSGPIETAIAPIHHAIADFVAEAADNGKVPVSLAGDCCASIPVLAGLQRAGLDPILVWLDAHGDFNTPQTSPSGFLGGMPLAMIAGRGPMTLMREVGARVLPEQKIFLSDARDLDPLEAEALRSSDVRHVPNLKGLLEQIPDGSDIYLHFDSDIISSDEVPAQSYPVPGGPRSKDVKHFFAGLVGKTRIIGMSMSGWMPDLDMDGSSGRIVRDCFGSLLRRIG